MMINWRLLVVTMLLSVYVQPSFANMPMLTKKPQNLSTTSCKSWASKQDEDAIYMWGTQDSGKTDKQVALQRLTQYCLTGNQPEIVGVNSSIGVHDAYCKKHKDAGICGGSAIQSSNKAPYEGYWAPSEKDCKDPTDGNFSISGKEYQEHEGACSIKTTSNSGNNWKFTMSCEGEGEKWNLKRELQISGSDNILDITYPKKIRSYIKCRSNPGYY